jgi:hypothetical protein
MERKGKNNEKYKNDELENKIIEELNRLECKNKKNIIKIKFANIIIKLSNNIKNENYIYNDLYKNYLESWKSICIIKENSQLYTLIEYLLRDDISIIRKTIIGTITDEKLEDELYLQFVEEFINL